MIDTTTTTATTTRHSFNHCGGGGGGAVASAAATSGNSNSGIIRNHHLNSEQDLIHLNYQHQQHNYHHHSTYSSATVHHQAHLSNNNHHHHHHQLTELSSVSEQQLAHEKLANKPVENNNEQQFYYSNSSSNLNDTGYHSWSHNSNNSSSNTTTTTTNNNNNNNNNSSSNWQNSADESKTNQQFSSTISPSDQRQQWQQEPTSGEQADNRAKRQHQPDIYQRAGFSPSEAVCALYQHQQQQPAEVGGDTATVLDETTTTTTYADSGESVAQKDKPTSSSSSSGNEFNQLRILEMRKEKSRDAARSRRSKENHEFYELAKLLPLPAAITSQLDFLDKASIIRLTISFLKLRQFSVNGYPPWAPDFATLGSVNPYSSQVAVNYAEPQYSSNQDDDGSTQSRPGSAKHQSVAVVSSPSGNNRLAYGQSTNPLNSSTSSATSSTFARDPYNTNHQPQTGADHRSSTFNVFNDQNKRSNNNSTNNYHKNAASLFDIHQGTHILQSLDGFAFAIGRDGRFLYISETVSMYLGLSQVEMTGSSVFDYTHQQDHEELARHLGIQNPTKDSACDANICPATRPASVHSQYSAASNETLIEDYLNHSAPGTGTGSGSGGPSRKRAKASAAGTTARGAYGRSNMGAKRAQANLGGGGGGAIGSGSGKATIKIEANTSDNNVNVSQTDKISGAPSKEMLDSRVQDELGPQGTEEDPLVRQFCIRMKSTLTKRGCQHFKSSGYRVVHVVAHLRSYQSNDHGHLMDPLDEPGALQVATSSSTKQAKRRGPKCSSSSTNSKDSATSNKQESGAASSKTDNGTIDQLAPPNQEGRARPSKAKIIGMVAVAIALPPPSINELRLESDTFVLRLSLDLRITHIEPRITELLHYPVELIAGRSLYSLIHPADAYQVQKCHRDLLSKGQMMSGYYRLLARNGGYIWIQTCATLICNNTNNNLSGQVPILAQSPSSSAAGMHNPMTPLSVVDQQQQQVVAKLPGYLAPSLLGASSNQHSKLLSSPGVSSHISSNYDNLDQDQCVIFVNYMITNVIEQEETMDICQSQDFSPLSSFAGHSSSSSSIGNNNIPYTSPSSSCSSPCMGSLKSVNNNNNNNNNTNSYVHSTSANPATPTRRQLHTERSKDIKSSNGRRAANSHNKTTKYLSTNFSDENGTYNQLNTKLDHQSIQQQQQQQQQLAEVNDIPSDSNAIYASSYHSTPGSVNLALNSKIQQQGVVADDNHWQSANQQQQQQHHHTANLELHRATNDVGHGQAAAAAMVYGSSQSSSSDHYSAAMDRTSIYKAAFELNAANYGTTSHHHHQHHHQQQQQQQQQAQLYPTATGQVVAYGSGAPAVCQSTGWDNGGATAAAVAAVAAASSLTSHHHHQVSAAAAASNPYAHLEPHNHHHLHHHHQQAAAAAAAHSLTSANHHHPAAVNHHHSANHHHTSAGNYYNYYGYYGNKFI